MLTDEELSKLLWDYKPQENTTITKFEYINAKEAKKGVVQYVAGVLNIGTEEDRHYAWETISGRNRSRVFCAYGQMGKGKTRMQLELCRQGPLCTDDDFGEFSVRFVRITYSEGFTHTPGSTLLVFAQNLLVFQGMGADTAKLVPSLEAAVKLLWAKVPWQAEKERRALVVCVDEILQMRLHASGVESEDAQRGALVRELSSFSDDSLKTDHPVIFIFSAVTATCAVVAQVSGRAPVEPAYFVPDLPFDDCLALLWAHRPDLQERSKTDTTLQQLVYLCGSIPRALLEGIPCAYPEGVGAVTMESAVTKVADAAKLTLRPIETVLKEDVVARWVRCAELPADREELVRWGVAEQGPVAALNPLALRYWCEKMRGPSKVAYHLREAYVADAAVQQDQEKHVETLLCHFEAAKRLMYGTAQFRLGDYYVGADSCGTVGNARVTATPELLPHEAVRDVPSFRDTDRIVNLLRGGAIVVSKDKDEAAIKYLVPFFVDLQLKYVAAVQVKFRPSLDAEENGNEVAVTDICDTAMACPVVKALKGMDITCFTVLFSTVHGGLDERKGVPAVLYSEEGLFTFTKRLGPLRVHREKASDEQIGNTRSCLS